MDQAGMRFLSFSGDKEDAEKEAKLKEAAKKIEAAIARDKSLKELIDYVPPSEDEVLDPENDTRPLYERLLEQKNKKQQTLEESQKLSNLVTKLDEVDADYLNEVAKMKREEEVKKRLEVYDVLEARNEKKILEDEIKLKKSLVGSRPKHESNPLKLRLSSLIKMKPKPKTKQKDDRSLTKTPSVASGAAIDQRAEGLSKRSVQYGNETDKVEKRQKNCEKSEDQNPTSTADVMQCIGILPSLPIVKDCRNSSEESENSDDDIVRPSRMIRIKRKK